MTKTAQYVLGICLLHFILFLLILFVLPNILISRSNAQEANAFRNLQLLYEAEKLFQSRSGGRRYGSMEELRAYGLIDAELASGLKQGYRFEVVLHEDRFEGHAIPITNGYFWPGTTGKRSFFINNKYWFTSADKKGGRADVDDELLVP